MSGETGSADQMWTAATRSAPIVIQAVLAVLAVATWLWNESPAINHEPRAALLAGTASSVVLAAAVAAALYRRKSVAMRAIGLSTAASAAIVLIGAIPYAFWLL